MGFIGCMKQFILLACAAILMTALPAFAWDDDDDDDGWGRRDSRPSYYDNPFDKPKDRGPWYEERVRKEDRVRTYAPSRSKTFDPYDSFSSGKAPERGSASHGVLRQLDTVR